MPQVYVYFHPILVDVPDNVILALNSDRDKELAKQVAANMAYLKLTGSTHDTDVDLNLVEAVVRA